MANNLSNQLNAGYDKLLNSIRIASDIMAENGISPDTATSPTLTNMLTDIAKFNGKVMRKGFETATRSDVPTNAYWIGRDKILKYGAGMAYTAYLNPLWEGSGNPPGTKKQFISPVSNGYAKCRNYYIKVIDINGHAAFQYYPEGKSDAEARIIETTTDFPNQGIAIVPNSYYIIGICVDQYQHHRFFSYSSLSELVNSVTGLTSDLPNNIDSKTASFFVDAYGIVFVQGATSSGEVVLGCLNDTSIGNFYLGALKKKVPIITSFDVYEDTTTKCIYFAPSGTTGWALQFRLPTDAVNTPIIEVPMIAQGTLRINNSLVKVDNLAFAPDFVFVTFRGEAEVNIGLGNIIMSRQQLLKYNGQPSLALSDHKFIYESAPTLQNTIASDINTTLNSGYINQDGFVINTEFDYITAFADWVAIGRRCGVDPYLDA